MNFLTWPIIPPRLFYSNKCSAERYVPSENIQKERQMKGLGGREWAREEIRGKKELKTAK